MQHLESICHERRIAKRESAGQTLVFGFKVRVKRWFLAFGYRAAEKTNTNV
jgi:hypothetical protein